MERELLLIILDLVNLGIKKPHPGKSTAGFGFL
jgi:hypothetical protein